nr:RNA 2'-phosphotransferase [Defluviimonas salinarum]
MRHAPERIGLQLDKNGWVSIDSLLRDMKQSGQPLTRGPLDEIITTSDKQRFTMSDDGLRSRAAQGHSIKVDLDLPPAEPPEVLCRGTARANLDRIIAEACCRGSGVMSTCHSTPRPPAPSGGLMASPRYHV